MKNWKKSNVKFSINHKHTYGTRCAHVTASISHNGDVRCRQPQRSMLFEWDVKKQEQKQIERDADSLWTLFGVCSQGEINLDCFAHSVYLYLMCLFQMQTISHDCFVSIKTNAFSVTSESWRKSNINRIAGGLFNHAPKNKQPNERTNERTMEKEII